jgi:two-component system chemotaxis sensor kinase CheA
MDMSRYKKIFMEESREHLNKLGSLSLDMEKDPENMEVINAIFREAHSIKGMAASMGYTPISELTHKVEDLMDLIRKGEIGASSHIVDVLLRAIDILEAQLNAIETGGDLEAGLSEVLGMIERSKSGDAPEKRPKKDEQKQAPAPQKEPAGSKEEQAAYVVTLIIKQDEPKPNVKGLLGVKKLSELGRVMGLVPGLEEIKRGLADRRLKATLITGVGNDDIARALKDLPYLESFQIATTKLRSKKGERDEELIEPDTGHVVTVFEPLDEPPGGDDSSSVDRGGRRGPGKASMIDEPPAEWGTEEPDAEKETATKTQPVTVAPGGRPSPEEGPRIEEMLPSGEAGAVLPRSVRIGTDLLESFINIVGELLITKSRIQQQTRGLDITPLNESVNRLESLIRDLHTRVITVRMMPLESILSRMPRMVRDLAREKGKEIDFTITGGDIELDRAILEELTDPLVHILRNAVDHGIEPPELRQQTLGKPPAGKIMLSAYRERDLVILEVTDDGRGIDPEKIREAAVSRGIMKKQQIELLSDRDVVLLAFMPSLSTSKEVSDISGRGVGMDVVKTKVESLGGSVRLESTKGQGTKLVLILPLTVAIIQALLIKSAGETFALPLSKTIKSAEVAAGSIQMSQNQRVVFIDGDMIPLFRLGELLGFGNGRMDSEYISLVISEVRGKHIGLEVDEIIGSQEIFIKSLGYPLEKIQGFSGVTILGDGSPVLIIDIGNLF